MGNFTQNFIDYCNKGDTEAKNYKVAATNLINLLTTKFIAKTDDFSTCIDAFQTTLNDKLTYYNTSNNSFCVFATKDMQVSANGYTTCSYPNNGEKSYVFVNYIKHQNSGIDNKADDLLQSFIPLLNTNIGTISNETIPTTITAAFKKYENYGFDGTNHIDNISNLGVYDMNQNNTNAFFSDALEDITGADNLNKYLKHFLYCIEVVGATIDYVTNSIA